MCIFHCSPILQCLGTVHKGRHAILVEIIHPFPLSLRSYSKGLYTVITNLLPPPLYHNASVIKKSLIKVTGLPDLIFSFLIDYDLNHISGPTDTEHVKQICLI